MARLSGLLFSWDAGLVEASVGWVSEALPIALRVSFTMNSKFARIVKRADVGKRYDIGL